MNPLVFGLFFNSFFLKYKQIYIYVPLISSVQMHAVYTHTLTLSSTEGHILGCDFIAEHVWILLVSVSIGSTTSFGITRKIYLYLSFYGSEFIPDYRFLWASTLL